MLCNEVWIIICNFFSLWPKLALRGEAVLKSRLPKEAKKNAAISPCEKSMTEAHCHWSADFHTQIKEQINPPCEGELLQHTRKGNSCWSKLKKCLKTQLEDRFFFFSTLEHTSEFTCYFYSQVCYDGSASLSTSTRNLRYKN